MADLVICEKTDLTGIANEVRTISGISNSLSLDAIQTELNNANSEANIQADLISQITTALEGKAAGGGSGNGSGETSVSTCSFIASGLSGTNVWFTVVDSENNITTQLETMSGFVTLGSAAGTNVVCGSLIIVNAQMTEVKSNSGTAELVYHDINFSIIKASTVAMDEIEIM